MYKIFHLFTTLLFQTFCFTFLYNESRRRENVKAHITCHHFYSPLNNNISKRKKKYFPKQNIFPLSSFSGTENAWVNQVLEARLARCVFMAYRPVRRTHFIASAWGTRDFLRRGKLNVEVFYFCLSPRLYFVNQKYSFYLFFYLCYLKSSYQLRRKRADLHQPKDRAIDPIK